MKWWDDLSIKQKLVYSGTLMTSGGASIGGLTADRTLLGIGVGALIGVSLWGLGVMAYSAWQVKQAASKIPGVGHLPPLS